MKKKKIDFKKDLPQKLGEHFFPKAITSEIVIIKCHLLIEYALDYFIDTISEGRYEEENFDFTFSHKFKLAILLGMEKANSDKEIRIFIEDLNKLRNQIAHNIEFDTKLLDKIVDKTKYYDPKKYDSIDKFYQFLLREKTAFIAGRISAIAEAFTISPKSK